MRDSAAASSLPRQGGCIGLTRQWTTAIVTLWVVSTGASHALELRNTGVPGGTPGTDFNGDGDVLDNVLHFHDAQTGRQSNELIDVVIPRNVVFNDTVVVVVPEARQRSALDLNGDGDLNDRVPFAYDLVAGTSTNLRLDGERFAVSETGRFAVAVSESGQQVDLNSDGDQSDAVVHLFDPSSGRLRNLGLALGIGFEWGRRDLGMAVREFQQGADLNGDGDSRDTVPHLFEAAGVPENVALGRTSTGVSAEIVAVVVPERERGEDLNEDGDTDDSLLFVAGGAAPPEVVNDSVALTADPVTSLSTVPTANGPAGTFVILATFTNTRATALGRPFFKVAELSGGNLLVNGDAGPGGAGTILTPDVGADGTIAPGESITVEFRIALQSLDPFTFFVDILGRPVP